MKANAALMKTVMRYKVYLLRKSCNAAQYAIHQEVKMNKHRIYQVLLIAAAFATLPLLGGKLALLFLLPLLIAHCDTIDGPVLTAAKKALKTGNVDLVLVWVQPQDEDLIRKAFQQTLEIRKLSPEAKAMADMYFFETLVRIHRAGEGAPYDGIKFDEAELEPGVDLADKAIESGSVEDVVKNVLKHTEAGIRKRFADLQDKKKHAETSVKAGREYVEQYVIFVHYIAALHEAMLGGSAHGEDHHCS